MSRLDILKSSLKKKEDKFNKKINEHFEDVASANGQPLNDKRNGPATMRRWDRQNNAISNLQKEIDKTKSAIEREEGKLIGMARNKELMPKEITDLIDNGILIQWGKYPHILFVNGVDKARIIWDSKKKAVMHKFVSSITDADQRKIFARVYNSLHEAINKKEGVNMEEKIKNVPSFPFSAHLIQTQYAVTAIYGILTHMIARLGD